MTPTKIDRARIAAYVDGELTPEEAAAVAMHLADHPEDQAYADDLFAANAALAAAFAAPLQDPVPQAIRDVILPSTAQDRPRAQVLPFPRRPATLVAGLSLAASIALAVALFRQPGADPLTPGPVAAGSELAEVLNTLPSGEIRTTPQGGDLMILATLPTPGGFCRELERIDAAAGDMAQALACRGTGPEWEIVVVLTEPLAGAPAEDGFIAAEGAASEGLTPFLDQAEAGLALTPEEEAALISKGWTTPTP